VRGAALALLLAAGSVPAAAQVERAPVPLDHLPALAGDYFHLPWPEQNRGFHIYVRLPADYGQHPNGRYPVIYLLDGDSLFPILGASHLFLTYDEGLPEAIVVGIAYGGFDPATNRRGLDFTSPAPGVAAADAGAPAFHAFLKERILPEVERRSRGNPARRILVGQSRAGAFILHSAFADPDLFWGRIASNPSFSGDGQNWFGNPAVATRRDLHLIVTRSARDRQPYRGDVLRWWESWRDREDRPWTLRFQTIENGTHAANITDAYRLGLLTMFQPERRP